jgi:hypothetical protein
MDNSEEAERKEAVHPQHPHRRGDLKGETGQRLECKQEEWGITDPDQRTRLKSGQSLGGEESVLGVVKRGGIVRVSARLMQPRRRPKHGEVATHSVTAWPGSRSEAMEQPGGHENNEHEV